VACLGLSLGAVQLVSAQAPSAYLLVEIAAGSDGGTVIEELRSLSLANCPQLVESLMPGEAIAHVACNDLASVNRAVGDFAEAKASRGSRSGWREAGQQRRATALAAPARRPGMKLASGSTCKFADVEYILRAI
jgi:hypothetical protein